jgi:AraC-like DNA-binding protein
MNANTDYAELYYNSKIVLSRGVCDTEMLSQPIERPGCFHAVRKGSCQLKLDTGKEYDLNAGDFVIFTKFIRHTLAPLQVTRNDNPNVYSSEADFNKAEITCGIYRPKNSISFSIQQKIPDVILPNEIAELCGYKELFKLFELECKHMEENLPNDLNVICDLIIKKAFSRYQKYDPEKLKNSHGERLIKAISCMQENPEYPWTLERLAKICHMSRNNFAVAFKEELGLTAMQFLLEWRMNLAWDQLERGKAVEHTAQLVGYTSSSAFSNAFHSFFGIRPKAIKNN